MKNIPTKDNIWVFIMAGQSNMVGGGKIESEDTLISKRVLSINKKGKLIYAREPIHFYERTLWGLSCGLSFGKKLTQKIPDSISILLIPTAIGGSSINQWNNDSIHRKIKLLTNFKKKVNIAKNYGQIKGILWHQGETEALEENVEFYKNDLKLLMKKFRIIIDDPSLPIIIGELGSYSKNNTFWELINQSIREVSSEDKYTVSFSTSDLKDRGDKVHFNSESQRILGQRYADEYIKLTNE